jgi:hypothetical protein
MNGDAEIGSRADRAPAYLARAIRGNDYIRTQDRIITDNTLPPGPASRRKWIAGILRSAKIYEML